MTLPARIAMGLAAISLSLSACSSASSPAGTTTIAVIPKGTSHVFWQSIHAGAEKAAQELGVSVIWRGPLREDDRASQIAEVEGFITRGVVGHRPGAARRGGAGRSCRRCGARENSGRHYRFGTEGRRLRELRRHRQSAGRPHCRRRAGQAAAGRRQDRHVSLRGRIGEHDRARRWISRGDSQAQRTSQVLSSNQYGGADVEGAYKKAEAMLHRFRRPDGVLDVDGIFASNESNDPRDASRAAGQRVGRQGQVHRLRRLGHAGQGMSDGDIDGLVVQDPVNMGYLGVKTMVDHLKAARSRSASIPECSSSPATGCRIPPSRSCCSPILSRWLKP